MSYPVLEWSYGDYIDVLKMNGEFLVDIRYNRYLRFTSKGGDTRMIGMDWNDHERKICDWTDLDLGCWGFGDPKCCGYKHISMTFEDHPEEGYFLLDFKGGKNQIECRNDTQLKGVWHEEEGCFHYFFTTDFECALEDLYQNSVRCEQGYARDPQGKADIEVFDFFINYTSLMDIVNAREYTYSRPLYQWYVMSENGQDWVKNARVHIPDTTPFEDEEKSLIKYPTCYGKPDSYVGFVDNEYGGWLLHTLDTPAPISHQLCWMFYDIHVYAPNAIPPRGSCERISMHYSCEFIPITAERSVEIMDSAREYNWREGDKYDVPRFSYDNRFDDSLRTLPGDKTSQLNFWCKSDENCRMDHSLGYDDTDSVMIERKEYKAQPLAWYCTTWGIPYDTTQRLGRRYRFSAMIKTEDCTGLARIGKASSEGGDVFYGVDTHYASGEPKFSSDVFGGHYEEVDLYWAFSDSVTGTNDWTLVSVEFDAIDFVITVFLEMSGTGKCWFDNVKLEDIGSAKRRDINCTPFEKYTRFEQYWKGYDPMKD